MLWCIYLWWNQAVSAWDGFASGDINQWAEEFDLYRMLCMKMALRCKVKTEGKSSWNRSECAGCWLRAIDFKTGDLYSVKTSIDRHLYRPWHDGIGRTVSEGMKCIYKYYVFYGYYLATLPNFEQEIGRQRRSNSRHRLNFFRFTCVTFIPLFVCFQVM